MEIVIVGTGYVGLPVGACFADFGNRVTCVDKDQDKISLLKAGKVFLYEPELEEIVKRNIDRGTLQFSLDVLESIQKADIVIITVGTPADTTTGHADLRYIKEVVEEIAFCAKKELIIAIKSTVPCGTGDLLEELIKKRNPKLDFDLISIPEFLREGKAINDFLNPDRIVIGINSNRSKGLIENLYRPLIDRNVPIMFIDRKSAELAKYVANCFLGIKVGFINEIADLCEKIGADIRSVKKAVGSDSRIGSKFLSPGPGFGGSCFPKDMLELIASSEEKEVDLAILKAAFNSNSQRPLNMLDKIKRTLGNLTNKKLAIWGLAFKAETDDIRMSPAIDIINFLKKEAKIISYDPQAMENAKMALQGIEFADDPISCSKDADAIILLTEWEEFKRVNPEELQLSMRGNIIIDLRNILDGSSYVKAGFEYVPIGYEVSDTQ